MSAHTPNLSLRASRPSFSSFDLRASSSHVQFRCPTLFGLRSSVPGPLPSDPHAPCPMLHASMLHAPSPMPVAPCPMLHAPCSTPDPVARVASGMWLERAPQLGMFWVPSIGWAVAEARKRRVAVDVANHRIARPLQLGRLQGSPVNNLRISCHQVFVESLGLKRTKALATYRSVALSLP